jgi:hypothetical protein
VKFAGWLNKTMAWVVVFGASLLLAASADGFALCACPLRAAGESFRAWGGDSISGPGSGSELPVVESTARESLGEALTLMLAGPGAAFSSCDCADGKTGGSGEGAPGNADDTASLKEFSAEV